MTKHNANHNPPTSCCFTTFFKRFICTTNPIPTHPSPTTHHIPLQKPIKIDPFTHPLTHHNNNNPGIIARLMGLDSLPNNQKNTTLDSLFRSKSLNSIHFIPDFEPTRNTFHRRARTSASFHEHGHKFLVKIDENLEIPDDNIMLKETMICDHQIKIKKSNREKQVVLKEREASRRKDNGYRNGTSNCRNCSVRSNNRRSRYSNSSNLEEKNAIQKRKLVACNKEKEGKFIRLRRNMCTEVQSDHLQQSSSPVSVLGLQKEFIPFSKGKRRDITKDSTKRGSSPKMKSYENVAQPIMPKIEQNYELTNYFVEMLGQVCKLSEEKACEPKWVTKCESMKLHFVEELSKDLGQYMLNLLLDELLYEILISCN